MPVGTAHVRPCHLSVPRTSSRHASSSSSSSSSWNCFRQASINHNLARGMNSRSRSRESGRHPAEGPVSFSIGHARLRDLRMVFANGRETAASVGNDIVDIKEGDTPPFVGRQERHPSMAK